MTASPLAIVALVAGVLVVSGVIMYGVAAVVDPIGAAVGGATHSAPFQLDLGPANGFIALGLIVLVLVVVVVAKK